MCSLKGVNWWENFGSEKNLLHFYVNVHFLNKLLEYVNLTDALKFGPKTLNVPT